VITPGARIREEDVARHYDELDDFYRDVWGDHVHHGFWRTGHETTEEATRQLIDELLARLDLPDRPTVLDAGCGYAATARLLVDELGADVTAVTLSRRQYDVATLIHQGIEGLTLICGDVLELDLPAESLDAIIAIESLAHLADKQAFFDSGKRVLRPGGRIGLCVWLAPDRVVPSARRLLLEPICREGRLPSLPSLSEYSSMAQSAGLAVVSAEDVSANVRRTWVIIATRVVKKIATDARYRERLLDPSFDSRVFALTVIRLLVAYYTGAMRYGMIVLEKAGRV
jgi:tocopherol O-methyltransferase